MGCIREPEGVDFVICSAKLSPKEAAELTEFFRQCKLKNAKRKTKFVGQAIVPKAKPKRKPRKKVQTPKNPTP